MSALYCETPASAVREAVIIPFPRLIEVNDYSETIGGAGDVWGGWPWTNRGIAVILIFWAAVFALGLTVVVSAFLAVPDSPLMTGEISGSSFGFSVFR